MIETTLRQVFGNEVLIKDVRATKGKIVRFEPVKALFEQEKIKFTKRLGDLEVQLLTSSDDLSKNSPNCVDALVWAIYGLTNLNRKVNTYYS